MKKDEKTNVMRVLDQKHVKYESHLYLEGEIVNGMEIAAVLGEDPARTFKTLVTVGKSGKNYVFVIPVCRELDLKKAASAAGEKNIEMLKAKDLLPLTGYVHGGCSPVGMKKFFPTFFHSTAADFPTVYFSAGRIGCQVELKLDDLKSVIPFSLADLCTAESDPAAE